MRKKEWMEDDSRVIPQKYLDMSLEELEYRIEKLERRLNQYTRYKVRDASEKTEIITNVKEFLK